MAEVQRFALSPDAALTAKEYLRNNPAILAFETHFHGVAPLQDLGRYFFLELHEPNHANILHAVVHNGGYIAPVDVMAWIRQENHEMIQRGVIPPPPHPELGVGYGWGYALRSDYDEDEDQDEYDYEDYDDDAFYW